MVEDNIAQPVQSIQPQVNTTQDPQLSNLAGVQQDLPQPEMVQPQTIDTPPKGPKSLKKKILIVIGGFLILGIVLVGFLLFRGVKDAPKVQGKVTSFMQNVSSENYQSAYAITSKDFKETTSMEEFTKAMSLFKAQYTEFQSQEQTGFSVEANAGQPTLYKYSAVVNYIGGDKGELAAVLIKEDGDYKILSIVVNVSVDRGIKFQQSEQKSVLGVSSKSK